MFSFNKIVPFFLGYDLFLSYAQSDGRALARRLEDQLGQRRFIPFRDETEMPPGMPLSDTLKRQLRRSRFLVVLVTPRAVKSPWVNEEVAYFATQPPSLLDRVRAIIGKRGTRAFHRGIIFLRVDGTALPANWNPDGEITTEEIKGNPPSEEEPGGETSTRESQKAAPTDEELDRVVTRIEGAFNYVRRSTIMRFTVASALLVFFALSVAILINARQLVVQSEKAMDNVRIGAAGLLKEVDPTRAALLLTDVTRQLDEKSWQRAAWDVFKRPMFQREFDLLPQWTVPAAFSASGDGLTLIRADGEVWRHPVGQLGEGRRLFKLDHEPNRIRFSGSGETALLSFDDGGQWQWVRMSTGTRVAIPSLGRTFGHALSHGGDVIAFFHLDETENQVGIRIFRITETGPVSLLAEDWSNTPEKIRDELWLNLSHKGDRLALLGPDELRLLDLATDRTLFTHAIPAPRVERADLSADGVKLAWSTPDGTVHLWRAGADPSIRPVARHASLQQLRFDPAGEKLLVHWHAPMPEEKPESSDPVSWITLLDLAGEKPVSVNVPSLKVKYAAFNWAGDALVALWETGKGQSAVGVWTAGNWQEEATVWLNPNARRYEQFDGGASVEGALLDPTGRYLLTVSAYGHARLWPTVHATPWKIVGRVTAINDTCHAEEDLMEWMDESMIGGLWLDRGQGRGFMTDGGQVRFGYPGKGRITRERERQECEISIWTTCLEDGSWCAQSVLGKDEAHAVQWLEVATGKQYRFQTESMVFDLAIAPDDPHELHVGLLSGDLMRCSGPGVPMQCEKVTSLEGSITHMAFSRDGRFLAMGNSSEDLVSLHRESGRQITVKQPDAGYGLNGMIFTDAGLVTAFGDGGQILLHHGTDFSQTRSVHVLNDKVATMALHPDGRTLAIGAARGVLAAVDVPLGEELFNLAPPGYNIPVVHFVDEGEWIGFATDTGEIGLLPFSAAALRARLETATTQCLYPGDYVELLGLGQEEAIVAFERCEKRNGRHEPYQPGRHKVFLQGQVVPGGTGRITTWEP